MLYHKINFQTIQAEDPGHKFGTASVNIKVTDVNDETPQFLGLPYSFRVLEGTVGATVGKVEAKDSDVGLNAKVSYSLIEQEQESSFSIDSQSGEIRTTTDLDFEHQPVHYVIVSASDDIHSSTATATILVQDTSDEVPYFEKSLYNVSVSENVQDFHLATVLAQDLDTDKSITYRLIQGDPERFGVDSKTGQVKVIKGLDYERAKSHTLVIGTEEGHVGGSSSRGGETTTLQINVIDVNDIPPLFTQVPRGHFINVRNDVRVGEKIGGVVAMDSDASEPFNHVRYELLSSKSDDKVLKYFTIDDVDGDIYVMDDLTKEIDTEYKLEIRAYDKGTPSLDTKIMIVVVVQQVVTVSPESGIGFIDYEKSLKVLENENPGTVLTSFKIDLKNNRKNLPIKCLVTSVMDSEGEQADGLFGGQFDSDHGMCQLVLLLPQINREEHAFYNVNMKLKTLSAFVNPNKMEIKVAKTASKNSKP